MGDGVDGCSGVNGVQNCKTAHTECVKIRSREQFIPDFLHQGDTGAQMWYKPGLERNDGMKFNRRNRIIWEFWHGRLLTWDKNERKKSITYLIQFNISRWSYRWKGMTMRDVIWVLRYSHFTMVLRGHRGHGFRHTVILGRVQNSESLPWEKPNEMINGTEMRLCSRGTGH